MRTAIRNSRNHYDFEISESSGHAILVDVVYTLVPPAGMEFDEKAVRYIRASFDPGFIPFHRVMVFKASTGGFIKCHNWGVCRYSEHGVQNEMLRMANRPATGYFSTLEHPTDIDGIYPFGCAMDKYGLPPPYERFDGAKVQEHCRREYGLARAKYAERVAISQAKRLRVADDIADQGAEKVVDHIPRTDWSTHVPPSPAEHRIAGEANA
jgi:hypothetical protein